MDTSARTFTLLLILLMHILLLVQPSESSTSTVNMITPQQKRELRAKSVEMFYHAYNAYMNNAYPADELMPLSCKGRYRGVEPSRGDVDDTLGNFTLTLIDTLDTLAILGDMEEFERAVRNIIRDSRFDADIVVSVFETNIRILGGLLGGHVAAIYFKRKRISMLWYQDELLTMAKEVGDRLLPAFNTTTGIPYPRVNLKHGITPKIATSYRDTCTSCAGTMILEFAALSRLTGISVYEEKARKAMDYLWTQRHRSNNLMGMVINIHNGDWVRRESGVGAGIDSYYEYVLKAYVLLGDDVYLSRFNKHYEAVMRYVSQGPMLVDVHMHKPTSAAKNFMDALLAFWPGLQVLVGDIGPAVETHEMLYQIVQRHNFLPEAFTTDFRVHWGQHLLRPEFLESTYFLYQATADPYYLVVGKTVLENLEQHARVECGFAAIKDIKTGSHENQMDSFVLAETFKYLYLLFSEKEDIILNLDDFIFTTEAHLLPLALSIGNYSWKTPPKVLPDIYKFDMMSVAEMTKLADDEAGLDVVDYDEDRGVCRNYHVTNSEGPGYPHRLRHQLRDMVDKMHPKIRTEPQRLKAADFVAGNKEHLDILHDMGIRIATMPDGRIQLLHTSSEAVSTAHAEAGLLFMQEMIELSKLQKQDSQHEPMFIRLISDPFNGASVYKAGPSQFGYDLSKNAPIRGCLAAARPFKACTEIENGDEIQGKIAIIERGDCMFVDKARNLQSKGAIGGIVLDQAEGSSSELLSLFAMSGDGTNDVTIPAVFLFWKQGRHLFEALYKYPDLIVELTSKESVSGTADIGPEVPTPSVTSGPVGLLEPSSSSPASYRETIETGSIVAPTASLPSASAQTSTLLDSDSHHSVSVHAFYHHEYLDESIQRYFLRAGSKYFHLNVEVSPREEGAPEEDSRTMKYEPLPDGSKMFTFYLHSGLFGSEKPNLNEMYLDVIHCLQHHTNFEQLVHSQQYMKAIARFMESAFFSIDRIDRDSLELMLHFTHKIKVRHTFPEGETVFVGKSQHLEVNPNDEDPPPVTTVHTFKVSNNGLSSSYVSHVDGQEHFLDTNINRENVDASGTLEQSQSQHQDSQEHQSQHQDSQDHPSQHQDLQDHQSQHQDSQDHPSQHQDLQDHQSQHQDSQDHPSQHQDLQDHQSQHQDSHEHQSQHQDSHEHQSQQPDSHEHQSQQPDSHEHQSQQPDSHEHQSQHQDSQKHQSQQPDSHEHQSQQPDSHEHQSQHQDSHEHQSQQPDSHEHQSQHQDSHEHQSQQADSNDHQSQHQDSHAHYHISEEQHLEPSRSIDLPKGPSSQHSSIDVPTSSASPDKSRPSTIPSSLTENGVPQELSNKLDDKLSPDLKTESADSIHQLSLGEPSRTSTSSPQDEEGTSLDTTKDEL